MRRSKESSAEQETRGNFTPPSRTAVSPADVPVTPPPAPAGKGSSSKLSPRNWRVPTRLNAILCIPVLVGLVMGGFQVKTAINTWQEAQDAEKTALIVRAASEYSTALLNERDLTAGPLLTAKTAEDRKSDEVQQAYAATDAARLKFDEAAKDLPSGQGLERRLRLFKDEEPKLEALRKAAYTRSLDPVNTQLGYTGVQHYLAEFSNELGLGTGNVTTYGRSVYAIQLSKGAESLQRSIGTQLLVRPSRDEAVFAQQSVAFNSYNYLEQIALGEFSSGGLPEDVELLKKVMAGKAAEGAKQMQAADVELPKGKDGSVYSGVAAAIGSAKDPDALAALKSKGITAETWSAVATAKFEGYSEVEKALVDKAVAEAARVSDEAKTDAWLNGGIVVIALLAAFVLAGMMARQMSRSMRELRTAAFGIAEQRLPMLVDQLSRTEPGRVDTRVQPIPIDSQDEIGEVARAFDQVHREAVRLAAEQAMLRGNVNAIFTNLSRRNQSLIEGQLTLITDLENNEADPDQLENLFKLDHLATRMRRNGENLLVLAGEEPGRRWDQPVPLVDVMRAASSEVEQYERIELAGVPEAEIHGQAVTDLVHLLAELLENATTFSSPQTKVRVTATRLPDGRVMVEIHDKGIGLTAEDFADINHKLANPPTVDAAVSQRMGLFVVGRLADRHGIRVQLRPSGEQAGTTSLVMLPDAITHGGGGEQPLQDDFTVSQIMPQQQQSAFESAPQQPQPMLTAADLGFDDSRYEQPAEEERPVDPVDRSLKREGRRAALEAQTAQGGERPLFRDEAEQGGEYAQQAPAQEYGVPQQQAQEYPAEQYAPAQDYGQAQQAQGYGQEYAAGYPQQDGYGAGYAAPQQGYEAYPQQGYAEASYEAPESEHQQYGNTFDPQSHQAEWQDQSAYQGSWPQEYGTESESAPGAPEQAPERVGFDRPGPAPSAVPDAGHALTDAGLPRRGSVASPTQQAPQQQAPQPAEPAQPAQEQQQDEADGTDEWRSTNDERWQRAGKLKEPKAGGVTSSGLPRRVPKANLVEGTAEQTPQGGPQVSRAPEDVRGRLSNLRRGVQQGRSAGTDTNGSGLGPGNTYNQER
ncbi:MULTISPECIES: nitrate- and nitrite sensing domain-containing protein [unclassified Streptomyces]|uniref:sensor histidine kinase n=1 Tax=unclassified Streptomyces TaxID=2593676 RepID=UPI0006FB22EE|nr:MULTISPECIES: nitrate- and nitrite sensing domain-containing protein [unclassified Streptomyces]KQX47508.1 ATPase [Streptomyces sp. Root1304]KRA94816.1 ATPase [Streptomyces sp. Root66D1]